MFPSRSLRSISSAATVLFRLFATCLAGASLFAPVPGAFASPGPDSTAAARTVAWFTTLEQSLMDAIG